MADPADILIVGAGPAGMAAAVEASDLGLSVIVADDQPAPGGQVWRGVETVAERGDLDIFGADYRKGVAAVRRFRDANVIYRPSARVIGIEPDENGGPTDVLLLGDGRAHAIAAHRVIIATGAYERPTPFPGWTLPGVMTLGGAQTALKAADLAPETPTVVAGQGPLLFLLVNQMARAGIEPAAILRLDGAPSLGAIARSGPRALLAADDLAKGVVWMAKTKAAASAVVSLNAVGDKRLERVEWRDAAGNSGAIEARTLLVHDGVVPNAQLTRALKLPHRFDQRAAAWRPNVDPNNGAFAAAPSLFVAGDCAGVNGWSAAAAMGARAAKAAARSLGKSAPEAFALRARHDRARASRPLLETLYPPSPAFEEPTDETIVCRCEAVTAGAVRKAASAGAMGPNQLKAFLRAGMGPCQGRMCAQTVSRVLAASMSKPEADVGLMRVRMPVAPVTVGEMAGLNVTPMELPRS